VQKEALKGEINKLKTKIEEGQNDLMTQVSLYQKQTTTSANLEDKLAKLMEELQQKEKDLEKVSQEKSALQIEVDTGSIHQKIQHLTKNNSLIQSQLNEKEKERLEGSQEVKRLSLELKEKSSALENSHTLLDQSKCHLQAKDIKNYFSAKEIEKLTAALAQKEAIFHQQKSTMQETEELKTKNLEETIQQLKFELIKKSQTIDLSDKISQKIQENLLIARQEIQHLNEAQLFTQNQLENKEKERKEALQALENLNLTINKQKIEWNQKEQDPEQIAKKTNKNLEHYSQLENEQKELIQKLAGQIEEKEKLLIDKENLIKIYEEKNKHYQLTIIQKEEEISTLEENAKKTKGEYERRYKEYSEGFKIACQKDVEQYSKQLEKQCIRRIKINDKEAMLKIGNKDQEIKTLKQTNEDQADSLVETERRLKQTQARVACLNEDLDKQIEEAGEKDAKKKQEIKELREELLEVNKTVLERDRLIRSLQDKPIKKDAFLGTQLTAPLSRKNKRKSLTRVIG
jgi:chromosome segregation ATPase